MTIRLQKKEQNETSKLVSKHSAQMLELLKQKQDELRQELMVSEEDVWSSMSIGDFCLKLIDVIVENLLSCVLIFTQCNLLI